MPKAVASSRVALCQESKMKSAQDRGSDNSAADGPFVPTVTAIATAPDLKWMVLSTDISSVSPCSGAAKQKRSQASQRRAKPSAGKAGHGAHAGRRKGKKEQLSPEEEERRRIRRERNKLAAAKCRNRRRELTDSLQAETDGLEEEKAALQAEISSLMMEKEQLELLLSTHQPHCKVHTEMQKEVEDVPEEPQKHTLVLQDVRSPSPTISLDKIPSSPLGLHEVPTGPQELEPTGPIILGDSDVLLCSSAELEPYIDVKDVPMEDPGSKINGEDEDDNDSMDLLVPDIDLTASLGLTEWETLYMTIGGNLDPFSTPTLISPNCSAGAVPVFDFPNPSTGGSENGKVPQKKAGGDNSMLLAL